MAKFITNQNIEIELELGSLGDRIFAFLIDLLVMIVLIIVVTSIVSSAELPEWAIYVIYIPLMFYSLAFEFWGNGQSLGKRAMHIKVVRLDGSTPTLGSYVLRWMFRLIDIWLYPIMFAPAVVSIIATKNGQRIGDLTAGTTVIKIREVGAAQAFKSVATEDHVVRFPAVKMLDDAQIELMKKALKRRKEGFSKEAVDVLAEKVKEKLQVESDEPNVKFLYRIIADYEHLA